MIGIYIFDPLGICQMSKTTVVESVIGTDNDHFVLWYFLELTQVTPPLIGVVSWSASYLRLIVGHARDSKVVVVALCSHNL